MPRILLAAALVLALPLAAGAQTEQWLAPKLGEVTPRADYRYTLFPDEPVRGQHVDFGVTEHRVSLTVPLWQNTTNELSLAASVKYQDIDTRAVLPDLGEPFPRELWDVKFGPTFRHRFDNGWIGGASLTLSSPSDRPFNSLDELVVRATAFLRVPHGERNAWFFMLTYSNYQEFIEYVPIPGIAYVYSPSDRFTAVIGLPFSSVQWEPVEKLTLNLTYVMLRELHARATYALFRPLRLYAGFDWDNFSYLRAGRGDRDDRIFYYEKRVIVGARFDLRHVGFEVAGGYAFDRYYFEGEGYGDRRENRLDIGDGPFVMARLHLRF